jgi:hypothetical protein
LQQRQRSHGIAVRERPEIFTLRVFCTAVHRQARMGIAAQKDKRIGFIITQQDVIARLVELYIVVLKQQRFCLGVRDGDINILNE